MKNGNIHPKNSSIDIIESIVSSIRYFGGELLTNAKVTKILVDKGHTIGIELNGGK